MIEDYITLFERVYWCAMVLHCISFALGFWVIACHGEKFKHSSIRQIFRNPAEWIYYVTILSTITNIIVIYALGRYMSRGHLGFLPSMDEFLFAFYHALEGVTVIGWHITSFLILKLNGRGAV